MKEKYAHTVYSHKPCSHDIIRIPKPYEFPSYYPHKAWRKCDPKGYDDIPSSLSEKAYHHQRKQNAGKAVNRIHHSHDHGIHDAAEISRNRTYQHSCEPRHGHHKHTYKEAGPYSLHDSGKDIPSEIIGAKDMGKSRMHKSLGCRHLGGSIRSPENGDECKKQHDPRHYRAHDKVFIRFSVYHKDITLSQTLSFLSDPGIKHSVEHIDDKIYDYHNKGDVKYQYLRNGEIPR